MLNIYHRATRLARNIQLFAFALPFPQRVLTRSASSLTSDSTRSKPIQQKKSKLSDAISIVKTLSASQLAKLAVRVAKQQKTLPIVLSGILPKFKGKFVVYDKEFADKSHKFKMYADEVHSYKLVWKNGEEMDLKLGYQTGTMAAGTVKFELQGLQVGPLIIAGTFPEGCRLPDSSSAEDMEQGVVELVEVCKKHGVKFKDSEEFASFIQWLMDDVISGSIDHLYHIVVDGILAEAYDNAFDNADEVKGDVEGELMDEVVDE